ncbi:basic proline-rich protein-like [Eschrichtius robustus]|uniref:basic proline-rich protein-like n=1 Tax=Eschrichtius robustus TaxID=9764 RepID=UPI0035C178C6
MLGWGSNPKCNLGSPVQRAPPPSRSPQLLGKPGQTLPQDFDPCPGRQESGAPRAGGRKKREGAEATGTVYRRAGEPQPAVRPGAGVLPAQSRPPGPSRAATPRASGPGSRRSGGPGTRRQALREGWWRRGAGQRSRPRLPPGRGPRPPAPAPRPHAAAEPGAPPCRGPPRPCTPASSGSARSCPGSQVSTYALVEVPPRVKNVCSSTQNVPGAPKRTLAACGRSPPGAT